MAMEEKEERGGYYCNFLADQYFFSLQLCKKKEMVENWTAIFFLLLHDSYRLHY